MDKFWQATADFLTVNGLSEAVVVAPEAFRHLMPTVKTYRDATTADMATIDALVLHKASFGDLDRRVVRHELERMQASFANEVFIVLTVGGEAIDKASPHLARLTDIRRWADGEDLPPERPVIAASEDDAPVADGRPSDPLSISQSAGQVYSQNNEDGILAEIFRRTGIGLGTFLEIGIENGRQNNTRFLLEQGWQGTWVDDERNAEEARRIFAHHVSTGGLQIIGGHVTAENINELLDLHRVPHQLDLISIDIDQNTTHVWRALNRTARVACIEYNASLPPSLDVEVPYDPAAAWDGSNWYGGSLKTVEIIGRAKGLSLVGCDRLGVNAFLVAESEAEGRFRMPYTAEAHYQPPRYHLTSHPGHPPSLRPQSWSRGRGGDY